MKRSSDYWIPLIALYPGTRLAEICELLVTDIYEYEGVSVFGINDEGEKSLKTNESSKRIAPIHKDLLKLKIIDYINHIKQYGDALFFLWKSVTTGENSVNLQNVLDINFPK